MKGARTERLIRKGSALETLVHGFRLLQTEQLFREFWPDDEFLPNFPGPEEGVERDDPGIDGFIPSPPMNHIPAEQMQEETAMAYNATDQERMEQEQIAESDAKLDSHNVL